MLDPTDDMPQFQTSGPVPLTVPEQPPTGELRMLRALMDDAHRCFLGLSGSEDEQREARRWVQCLGGLGFSFEYVCEMLRLDPDATRRQFARQQKQGIVQRWRVRGQVRRHRCMRQVA